MTWLGCSREAELKAEMESGHWPEASTSELRTHVTGCKLCQDAATLRQSFRTARAMALPQVQLPSPGLLWWRAQLRRRNAALARVQKPILGAQILALLVTLAIGAGLVLVEVRSGAPNQASFSNWLGSLSKSSAIHLEGLFSAASSMLSENLLFLTPALIILAVMGCLAALLVTDKS